MALGTVLNIPSGTQQQYRVPAGYEAPSITVLNPNNGTVYIARNGDANPLTTAGWDYKVPSQSYAALPGPYVTAGLYYEDSSGSNASGQVIVYDITTKIVIPQFQAIGIAVQAGGTTVDISQGNQPQNPPANTGRLWIDGSGHLNILQSNGANSLVIDSTNIGSQTLGGDLYGTISNAGILLQNIHYVQALGTAGAQARVLGRANTNSTYLFTGTDGMLYFYSDFPSVNMGNFNANTNALTIAASLVVPTVYLGTLSVPPYIQNAGSGSIRYMIGTGGIHSFETQAGGLGNVQCAGLHSTAGINEDTWIVAQQYVVAQTSLSANGGIVYFRNDNGIYIQWRADLSVLWTPNALGCSGVFYLFGTGYVIQCPNTNNSIYWNQSNLFQASTIGNPAIFRYYSPQQGMYFDFTLNPGGYTTFGGTNPYLVAPQFVIGGSSYAYLSLGRSANEMQVNVHMYVPGNIAYAGSIGPVSTRRVKKNLAPMQPADALALVLDPRPSSYRYEPIEAAPEGSNEADPKRFGFIAEEMIDVCPEVVLLDDEGLPRSMDYSQLVPVLWGAVRELNERINDLAKPVAAPAA